MSFGSLYLSGIGILCPFFFLLFMYLDQYDVRFINLIDLFKYLTDFIGFSVFLFSVSLMFVH